MEDVKLNLTMQESQMIMQALNSVTVPGKATGIHSDLKNKLALAIADAATSKD